MATGRCGGARVPAIVTPSEFHRGSAGRGCWQSQEGIDAMNTPFCIAAQDAQAWGAARGTHIAVALAIHKIATEKRPAQEIWEAPTIDEFETVGHIVVSMIEGGMFRPTLDGNYHWGAIAIRTTRPEKPVPDGIQGRVPAQSVIFDLIA